MKPCSSTTTAVASSALTIWITKKQQGLPLESSPPSLSVQKLYQNRMLLGLLNMQIWQAQRKRKPYPQVQMYSQHYRPQLRIWTTQKYQQKIATFSLHQPY